MQNIVSMTQQTGSVRRVLGAGFLDFLGSGLFLAFSAIYFTRVVGLPAARVGLGLGIAGLAAIAGLVPAGRVADRFGVRRMLVLLHLVRAGGMAAYAFVHGWWGFLAAVTVFTVADQSGVALNQALVAELAGAGRRVRVMAQYRTVVNVAIGLGAPLGGLLAGTGLYHAIILANAATCVAVAAVLATLPRVGPVRVAERRGLGALRDRRLLALAGLDGVLQLWQPVLNWGFPLWLAGATGLPRGVLGLLYAINAVLAVVLQANVAARAGSSVAAARRAQRFAACFATLGCLLFWAAPHTAALPVFCVALVLVTGAELTAVPAAWTLSYAIAPDDRRAEYLAAFGMGRSIGRFVLGPILITGLLQAIGGWAWGVLAAVFTLAGLAVPRIARDLTLDQAHSDHALTRRVIA